MPQQQELESLPSAQAQAWVPRASPQQELEWAQEKKRLPVWAPPLAEQPPRVSARALPPIPLPNAPPLLQQLPRPRHPSGARELSPQLPQSRNWNAFSFPLRRNPA